MKDQVIFRGWSGPLSRFKQSLCGPLLAYCVISLATALPAVAEDYQFHIISGQRAEGQVLPITNFKQASNPLSKGGRMKGRTRRLNFLNGTLHRSANSLGRTLSIGLTTLSSR